MGDKVRSIPKGWIEHENWRMAGELALCGVKVARGASRHDDARSAVVGSNRHRSRSASCRPVGRKRAKQAMAAPAILRAQQDLVGRDARCRSLCNPPSGGGTNAAVACPRGYCNARLSRRRSTVGHGRDLDVRRILALTQTLGSRARFVSPPVMLGHQRALSTAFESHGGSGSRVQMAISLVAAYRFHELSAVLRQMLKVDVQELPEGLAAVGWAGGQRRSSCVEDSVVRTSRARTWQCRMYSRSSSRL